jgi:hypothetical protein
MDPFPKDDPLYQLLGQSRSVEPRPNFTQNVMRTVRNTPQDRGWWAAMVAGWESFPRFGVRVRLVAATGALAAVVAMLWMTNLSFGPFPDGSSAPVAAVTFTADPVFAVVDSGDSATSDESVVVSELDSIDQLSDLLASQDTRSLTDGEIAMLLY